MSVHRDIECTPRCVVHVIAVCEGCAWSEDDYKVAARNATKHVRATGHSVTVDQSVTYTVQVRGRK